MLKSKNKKRWGSLLLLFGLITAIAAQVTLFFSLPYLSIYFRVNEWWENSWKNASPIPGISLYVLAGILFLLGLRLLHEPPSPLLIYTEKRPKTPPKLGFWITSLALSGVVSAYAFQATKDDVYGYLFSAAWVISIILFVVSVLISIDWRPPSRASVLAWLKAHGTELVVIITILTAAFLMRFLDVSFQPYSFINDEGLMGQGGECFLNGECTHFFTIGWAEQSRLAFFPYAVSIALFGRTALAVRLISVITGTLSVLAVYLFAREVFDKKIAWLSAILLVSLPVHVHFSRTGVDNIIDSLTAPLILWLLFRGIKRGSTLSFLAAGIVAGLCLYTYLGSLLALALGLMVLGWMLLLKRGFLQAHAKNIVIFVLAIVIVTIPMLGHYASHSDRFLARLKGESLLYNDRLESQAKNLGVSSAELLVSQFAKSSLVFIATDAPVNFFNSPRAYLPDTAAILFMLGMAYMLWRIKDLRYMIVLVWFWAVVILGSALTGGAPTSQRILMSMPPLVIITALGLEKILWAFKQFYQPVARLIPVVALALMLYIGYQNINYYFYDYRLGHYYEDPTNEFTYETGAFIAPLHTQGRMYLIANPTQPYLSFGNFNYFSPDVEKSNLNDITQEKLAALPKDKDILFIALPDYKSDLEVVAEWLPGGEWVEFKRRYQPESMLFYSYKITKEQLANIAH